MDVRAAVAFEAGKPLEVMTVQLEGPKAGEVLVEVHATGLWPARQARCGLTLGTAHRQTRAPWPRPASSPAFIVRSSRASRCRSRPGVQMRGSQPCAPASN